METTLQILGADSFLNCKYLRMVARIGFFDDPYIQYMHTYVFFKKKKRIYIYMFTSMVYVCVCSLSFTQMILGDAPHFYMCCH